MGTFLFLSLISLLSPTLVEAGAGTDPVRVKIRWDYKDFEGPILVHEAKGSQRLWEVKSVKSLSPAPLKDEIKNSEFLVSKGEKNRFALVYENKYSQPVYFFSTPHEVHPVEHSLGFKFKFLCINHAFTVGPKESWYRIVEFYLSKDFIGSNLTVTHSVIGIDQKRADSFSLKNVAPDL